MSFVLGDETAVILSASGSLKLSYFISFSSCGILLIVGETKLDCVLISIFYY